MLPVSGVVVIDLKDQVEQHPKNDISWYIEIAEIGNVLWLGTHKQ